MTVHTSDLDGIPRRRGMRPRTSREIPHCQTDQLVGDATRRHLSLLLIKRMLTFPHLLIGDSRRAPPGSIGLFLKPDLCSAAEDAFLLGNEIAHVHAEDDGSLHAVLPEGICDLAVERGWAEPHPLAGMPTVSPRTVLIYAPRDEGEVDTIIGLLEHGYAAARGLNAMGEAAS